MNCAHRLPSPSRPAALLLAALLLASAAPAPADGVRPFEAADSSGNYAAGSDWNGQNGGSGFAAWESFGDEPAVRTVDADGGFRLQARDEGQSAIVMRRDLDTPAGLAEGTASVKAWGYADEADDFVGFALFDGGSEIFRWGLGLAGGEEREDVFKYSTDGGASWVPLFSGYPADGPDYALTWASLGAGTTLTLSEASYFPGGRTIDLAAPVRVTAMAAVLEEGGLYSAGGNGTELAFDNLSVRGIPASSVPEPAASALLLCGLAALSLRRRGRGRMPPQKR